MNAVILYSGCPASKQAWVELRAHWRTWVTNLARKACVVPVAHVRTQRSPEHFSEVLSQGARPSSTSDVDATRRPWRSQLPGLLLRVRLAASAVISVWTAAARAN